MDCINHNSMVALFLLTKGGERDDSMNWVNINLKKEKKSKTYRGKPHIHGFWVMCVMRANVSLYVCTPKYT